MLDTILTSLGLTSDEANAYIHLLEAGHTTAGILAKQLNTPRPTVYGILDRLHQMGLVTQTINMEGVKVFSAEPPEKISILFDQKIVELKKHQDVYKELLEEIRNSSLSSLTTPSFQLFQGEDALRHALKDMLLYRNIETYSFWPIRTMLDMLSPEFFEYLNKERIKNNLYTKAIWPSSQIVSTTEYPYLGGGESHKREIRIAPPQINFSMGYWLYANKAAFISSRKESVGFIVESTELVEMLLVQHTLVWGQSKPLITPD